MIKRDRRGHPYCGARGDTCIVAKRAKAKADVKSISLVKSESQNEKAISNRCIADSKQSFHQSACVCLSDIPGNFIAKYGKQCEIQYH